MNHLSLDGIQLSDTECGKTLSGTVAGHTLYFKAPRDFDLACSANPFLAAMLIPAMQRKLAIHIPDEYPVSARLLQGIDTLQDILSFWYPALTRVTIHACSDDSAAVEAYDENAAGCLFSGGLDACYSVIKHREEITHLVYVRGIDLQLDNERVFRLCATCNEEIADYVEKKLVIVESNIRFFMRELESTPLSWYTNQAGGLAAVALALGLSRVYVSSSNAYDALHPLGSHPLTDPLWSTENTRIVHTGCEKRRHEKLAAIAEHDFILQRIRVCWHDAGFNCGVCDKCVHFRMALAIMGLEVGSLQTLDDFSDLAGAHVNTDGEYAEWEDNLLLARKHGNGAAEKAVSSLLGRYKAKKGIELLDEALIGGRLKALKNSLKR